MEKAAEQLKKIESTAAFIAIVYKAKRISSQDHFSNELYYAYYDENYFSFILTNRISTIG